MPASDRTVRPSATPDAPSAIFAGYRRGVDQTTSQQDRRIGIPDLVLAIGGNLAAIGFCFAPWMTYRLSIPDSPAVVSGRDTGFATDGWVLLGAAIVAIAALVVAAVQADQALAATVGFAATVVTFLTAITSWLEMDMTAPEGAEAVHAAWGVMAATGAAILATIFAFRAMRTARIY